MEDPITARGRRVHQPDQDPARAGAYSYVFDGQWGYLDHALASADARRQARSPGVADYHINADEPSVLDYNTEFKTAGQPPACSMPPDQFRVSDHDPVIVGLEASETSPTSSSRTSSRNTTPTTEPSAATTRGQVRAGGLHDPAHHLDLVVAADVGHPAHALGREPAAPRSDSSA
jgi:hypothetical protein